MKRITIHLLEVPKDKNKIINTISHNIKSEKEIPRILSLYEKNIKKYYLTNLK